MANVTYLFGAGGSKNALPILNKFQERIEFFNTSLQDLGNITNEENLNDTKVTLINNLKTLLPEINKHQTIDTLAKRLYLTEDNNLNNLKRILITFFLFEQILERYPKPNFEDKIGNTDKRYDGFVASLISHEINSLKMPDNVNILTWNYDFQIELSLAKYHKEFKNVFETYNIYPFKNPQDLKPKGFSVIHMNGVASLVNKEYDGFSFLNSIFKKTSSSLKTCLLIALEIYKKLLEPEYEYSLERFSYAWENQNLKENNIHSNSYEEVKNIALKTDCLVIIGYSFPFVNKPFDNILFEHLNQGKGRLKSIYIQDPNAKNLESVIKSTYLTNNTNNIKYYSDDILVNQFLLPPELDDNFKFNNLTWVAR